MKELSIEEKAKLYDMALENAKYYHSEMGDDVCCVLEECFPELQESEGERIRKEILEYFKQFENEKLCGVNISDWIVWLEKQDEPIWNEDDEQYLLVCKNALAKYQTTDKWDANIIYNWLKNKLQKNYDNQRKS